MALVLDGVQGGLDVAVGLVLFRVGGLVAAAAQQVGLELVVGHLQGAHGPIGMDGPDVDGQRQGTGQLQKGGRRAKAELAPQVVGVEKGQVGQALSQGLDVGRRLPIGGGHEAGKARGVDRQPQPGGQAVGHGLGRPFLLAKKDQVIVGVLEVGGVDDLLQEAAVGGDLLPRPGVLGGSHQDLDPLQRFLQGVGPRVGQQPKVAGEGGVKAGQLIHARPQLPLGEFGQVKGANPEGESLRHATSAPDRAPAGPRRRGSTP
jgi:hypothetical protein